MTGSGRLAAEPGGELLHVGGSDGQSIELLTSSAETVQRGYGGCSYANLPPHLVCHDPAQLGGTMRFELLRAEPLQLALMAWNDNLGQVPLATCQALGSPALLSLGVTDAFGRMGTRVALPSFPALIGYRLLLQAASFEVQGPVFGAFALSDSLFVQIGR